MEGELEAQDTQFKPDRTLKRKRTGELDHPASRRTSQFDLTMPVHQGDTRNTSNTPSRKQRKTSGAQSSPRKRARNISDGFDASLSPVGYRTLPAADDGPEASNSIASSTKRMLSRSLTEPVIAIESPFTSNMNKSAEAVLESSPSPRTPSHPTTTSTPTRTYASKSRSFLIALPASKLGSLAIADNDADATDEEPTADESQQSYTYLRNRWGVDISESDSPDPSPCSSPSKRKNNASSSLDNIPVPLGMTTNLKTIYELRDKGESRRFHDEVGYLFEGLDPKSSLSLRRAGALEIVTNLCNPDFVRKAKTSDFLGRAWDVLRKAGAGNGDQFLDVVLAFFSVLVAREPRSLPSQLAHKPDFVTTLFSMLSSVNRRNDILGKVSSGMGSGIKQAHEAHFRALSDVMSRSSLFPETSTMSGRLVISHALLSLPPALLLSQNVSSLRDILLSELSFLHPLLNDYLSGHSPFPDPSDLDMSSFQVIEGLLRLLQIWCLADVDTLHHDTTGHWKGDDDLAGRLVSLCLVSEALDAADQSLSKRKIACRCIEYALRILVGLTHRHQDWNRMIFQQEYFVPFLMRTIIRSHRKYLEQLLRKGPDDNRILPEEDEGQALDCFCIALGICTNLVQNLDEAKETYREIRIHCEPVGLRDCLRRCHCKKNRMSGLGCLTFVYTQLQEAGELGDPALDFLRGHLAILFGLLMQENVANQVALLKILPGVSESAKLHALLRQAQEFLTVYSAFRSRLSATTVTTTTAGDDGDEEAAPMLQSMIGIKDGKAESVARDVVSFLESLRDKIS